MVPPGNVYYIAGTFGNPEIVKVVSDQEVFDCPDLCSTQEEADTRMILRESMCGRKNSTCDF
jgi:hypothetical protein